MVTRSPAIRLILVLLVVVGLASMPVAAHADSDDDAITRYAVQADVQPDGSVRVILDFDFDFGRDAGHGPFLTLPERMAIEGDPDHWRSLPISELTASSPTAPAAVDLERKGGAVQVRIGDKDKEVTGTHTYRVSYRMAGVINPAAPGSGLDEFSWNPVGTEWEIPLRNVSVTVTTPTDVLQAACFTGTDHRTPCGAPPRVTGRSVAYVPGADLAPGTGLQVVAGMPAGSFPGVAPILTGRVTAGRLLGAEPVSLGLAGVTLAAGAAAVLAVLRRRGGRTRAAAVPVRTTPPEGVSPGLIGVLDDAVADGKDVVATLVDLAYRGHLRVEEGDDGSRWMVRTGPPAGDQLMPYEETLLSSVFTDTDRVDLAEDGTLASAMGTCHRAMYAEVTDRLGWFRGNPSRVRARWIATGLLVVLAGGIAVPVLGLTLHLGFVGIAVALVGFLICVLSGSAPVRTAAGTEIHRQAQGFKQYLSTVEASRVQVTPGVDLYSLYLPWAMMWGLTERWTGVFADLSERGVPVVTPAWYVATTPWLWTGHGSTVLAGVTGLDSAATSAMTSASTGSGGGSGFSGGGGVGGGGGGGW